MKTTPELIEAIQDVARGKVERIAKPGQWVVYLNDDGAVVVEDFSEGAK